MTLFHVRSLILISIIVSFFKLIGSRSLGVDITTSSSSSSQNNNNITIIQQPHQITTGGSGCNLIQEKLQTKEIFEPNNFLTVSNNIFDISDGIVIGIIYQVKLEIPPGYEFNLEYWGLVDGHVKHRHGRERRRDFIELSPSNTKTRARVELCSKSSYGGENKAEKTEIYTFDWFITRTTSSLIQPPPSNIIFRLHLRWFDGTITSSYEQSLNFEVKSNCNLRMKVDSKSKLSLENFWNSKYENVGLNCTVLIIPKQGFGLETRLLNLSIYGVRGLCKNRFLTLTLNTQNNNVIHSSGSGSVIGESEFPNENVIMNDSKFCGKIEDFSTEETILFFIQRTVVENYEFGVVFTLSLPGIIQPRETFSLSFNILSPCQKVFLTKLSGTYKYEHDERNGVEDCSIVIHVPYGNIIYLEFQVGDYPHQNTNISLEEVGSLDNLENSIPSQIYGEECSLESRASPDEYLEIHISENEEKDWFWCISFPQDSTTLQSITDSKSRTNVYNNRRVLKSNGNRIKISFQLKYFRNFVLSYESMGMTTLTKDCEIGQLKTENGCVFLVELPATWIQAEDDCLQKGGHLVSIGNEFIEQKLHRIIIESALFHPNRAYWIGGNDRESEGNFQWTSGLPFVYTNWFSGYSQKGMEAMMNVQPNDDGLSGQDCIELRQQFNSTLAISPPFYNKINNLPYNSAPADKRIKLNQFKGKKRRDKLYWNDINCEVKNFYICEKINQPSIDFLCNHTIQVGPSQLSTITFTSPSYPNLYPNNIMCLTRIETLPGYQIVINFDEFHLEDSPSCKYDYLEIREGKNNHTLLPDANVKRICGDWNKRLKLLRYVSSSTSLIFKFESDFSHHFTGFKANAWVQKDLNEQCHDQNMHSFGVFCYLIVSFPSVNWKNAHQFCTSLKGNLASVSSSEEWSFIIQTTISTPDYDKKSIYWLGGSIDPSSQLVWSDQMPFNFSAFHPSDLQSLSDWKCLVMYWHDVGGRGIFSWRLSDCAQTGGYICKKNAQVDRRQAVNRTFSGTGGKLSSPNYPTSNYYNNVKYTNHLIAPEGTQIVLRFLHLDIEAQEECLYDYIEIIDCKTKNTTRYCGTHLDTQLTKLDFVSTSNEVDVTFHSDFSETFTGFEVIWRAVDVTSCLSGNTILTDGGLGPHFTTTLYPPSAIYTPNFPHFNLPGLNCIFTIVAPAGQRILLTFEIFEIGIGGEQQRDIGEKCNLSEDHVIIELKDDMETQEEKQTILCGNLTTYPHLTTFISNNEKIRIRVISPEGKTGRGFYAKYKSIPSINVIETITVSMIGNSTIPIQSINYPLEPPSSINLTISFTSPAEYILNFYIKGSIYPNCHLTTSTYLIIYDPYGGGSVDGSKWIICEPSTSNNNMNELQDKNVNSQITISSNNNMVMFRTTFNRLEITQIYPIGYIGINNKWRGQIMTSFDENFRAKILAGGDRLLLLNACLPNPCANDGKCVTDGNKHICRCQPPFTGPFCGLSLCDLNPCLFGECLLENKTYRCVCQIGYGGDRCDRRSKPCDEKPCSGRGECVEVNNLTYRCFCHAFWEGPRCEARMQNIPYRPLSERMLREPFWLGIITVAVVLLFITLVWCLKRHFPEKLEKLLNDDFDRNNRGISWVSGRSPSSFRLAGGAALGLREPIPSTSNQQATSPQTSKSFLGRLGIRKPSLLSISSATSVSITAANSPHTYENRTFSLDDLLRPSRSSMMRTPSPHRRRNFSIHVRRDPTEKQQILQQLVSSGNSQSLDTKPSTPKPTIAEIIQMSEKRLRLASASSVQQPSPIATPSMGETSFINDIDEAAAAAAQSKAEKKVTFARLMDKLAATERSSTSSDSDEEKAITLTGVPVGTKKDRKGRFRRSKAFSSRGGRNSETDQDAVEMSSSDTTPDPIYTPRFPSRCISPTVLSPSNSPRQGKSIGKVPSADSLLGLFRRFSGGSNSAPPSPQYSENEDCSSAGATPLSTPSSPRNSALSLNFRPPPAFHITTPAIEPNNTIEVPIIDPFSQSNPGWRSCSQTSSITLEVPIRDYCLSPIHEVPTPIGTPMHSPAVTPMMQRQHRPPAIRIQGSSDIEDDELKTGFPSPPSSTKTSSSSSSAQHGRSFDIPLISISTNDSDDDEILELPFIHTSRRLSRDNEVMPDVLVHVPSEVVSMANKEQDFDSSEEKPKLNKTKPPPLIFAANILSFFNKDNDRDHRGDESTRNDIPILNVECATPIPSPKYFPYNTLIRPIEKSKLPEPDLTSHHSTVQNWDNLSPPMIIINQSSEAESDSDTPMMKLTRRPNLTFLSPFINSERVPSESNLSTSGYSSMASPCPSRCPSISPLCQLDSDDFHIHGPHCYGSRRSSLTPVSSRRSSLTGRRCSLTGTVSLPPIVNTTLISSNNNVFNAGHGVEKQCNNNTQGRDEINISNISEHDFNRNKPNLLKSHSFDIFEIRRNRLKGESLDSKLNIYDGIFKITNPLLISKETVGDKKPRLSPVSSRSDSPISEIGIVGGGGGGGGVISLTSPWTDSDGMYDCASSEVQPTNNVVGENQPKKMNSHTNHLSPQQELRRSGRRRNRRISVNSKKNTGGVGLRNCPQTTSPTISCLDNKGAGSLLYLDLPPSLIRDRRTGNLRSSPKRRVRAQPILDKTSSSSSSETINSIRNSFNMVSPIKAQETSSPEKPNIVESPSSSSIQLPASLNISHEELVSTQGLDCQSSVVDTLPTTISNPKPKISRLRTISLQIRFLRRLEQSLIRKRENLAIKVGSENKSSFHSDSTHSSSSSSESESNAFHGSESTSSFHETEKPLLSKSLRKKERKKLKLKMQIPLDTNVKARKKKLC